MHKPKDGIIVDARTRRFMNAAQTVVGDIQIDVYATGAPLPHPVPQRMFKCIRLTASRTGYRVDSIHGLTVAENIRAACSVLAWGVNSRARSGDYGHGYGRGANWANVTAP